MISFFVYLSNKFNIFFCFQYAAYSIQTTLDTTRNTSTRAAIMRKKFLRAKMCTNFNHIIRIQIILLLIITAAIINNCNYVNCTLKIHNYEMICMDRVLTLKSPASATLIQMKLSKMGLLIKCCLLSSIWVHIKRKIIIYVYIN